MRSLVLLWLVSLVACSGVQPAQSSADTTDRPRTTLEVRNRHPVDVDLYALDRTQRVRMGTVPARRTRTLVIPPQLLTEGAGRLRFQAEALGSDNLLTREEELLVREGEQLSLTLQ
ncbi:hypothetical protein [Hyalangium rubrum]|uniref:Lipoprotein n=1 Tax=Hyalangium rubrum TaxID=3103134 RepID=A0ABU5HIV2_9BACT|nr:hypothetical protein [Hyalangium sp. s54d21]MDY7232768.1 hypothetical protein [Hyalangium sp. s54d21]